MAKAYFRAFLWTGLPFVGIIVYLALHRAGKVERVPAIAYERTLIFDTLVLWALLAAVVGMLMHRRAVGHWLSAQKAQVALLLFSLVVSLGFCELALRILRPATAEAPFERLASELLHHRNAPDRSSPGMGGAMVSTNEDGFRSPYSRQEFLAQEHRIVLLGDSFTFGLGVEGTESVGAVLEGRLGQHLADLGRDGESVESKERPASGEESAVSGAGVAVLNTGVISYSPLLERQAYRKVARNYRPTVTLLLVDVNDIGDDYQYAREIRPGTEEDPRFEVPPQEDSGPGLCRRSALCTALDPVWDRLLGTPSRVLGKLLGLGEEAYDYYRFELEVDGKKETNRFFILRHPLETTRPFFETSWGYISDIARDVETDGSQLILVVMPRYFHWNDAECPQNWEKDRYGVDEPHENVFLDFFDQKAAVAKFPVWSLLGPFQAAQGPLVFEHDPHWNAAGHRVAGQALAEFLIEAGWPGDLSDAASRLSFPGAELPSDSAVISDAVASEEGKI